MKISKKILKAMRLKFTGIAFCFGVFCACSAGAQSSWQLAVDAANGIAPEARIIVLDARTGHLLSARNLNEAARTLAEPGSTLKPLILYQRIADGKWNPETRFACARNLQIEGHRLNCTHPQSEPFNASEALTWSCNTYFANLARTLAPGDLEAMLRKAGVLGASGLARGEATAIFHAPLTMEKTQLALLGVSGVRITPLELAEAYRWLAKKLISEKTSPAAQVVGSGLADSASFGMAGAARIGGVAVAGKTGTATQENHLQTHGWFAGIAPFNADLKPAPQIIIVVYLPAGRGTDAARVAAEVLKNSPIAKRAHQ